MYFPQNSSSIIPLLSIVHKTVGSFHMKKRNCNYFILFNIHTDFPYVYDYVWAVVMEVEAIMVVIRIITKPYKSGIIEFRWLHDYSEPKKGEILQIPW